MPKRSDNGRGPSQRQLRVGEMLRRSISDILMRGDVHDPDLAGVSVTVSEVRTSPDLKIATVFVLPLGGGNAELVLAALRRARGELRRQLNRQIDLKFSPELRFVLDETFDRMDDTRTMLSEDRVRRDLEQDDETPTGT